MQGWVVFAVALAYLLLLFGIAFLGDRHARRMRNDTPRPYIYSLSLAIYCTSWTFFGSVGLASERGFEFLTIYIGPILILLFGKSFLRRIVRICKTERITSVADFLAARYGKSTSVAMIATLIAMLSAIPYIALQLKAISGSVSLMAAHYYHQPEIGFQPPWSIDISLVVTLVLALFTVLFGTRHADATEHQNGLVLAVAVESVIKLAAFLIVGFSVTFLIFGPPGTVFTQIMAMPETQSALAHSTSLGTWMIVTCISAFAIFMLPRQFYVMFVESRGGSELSTARWLFPLYLVAINLFVLPLAFAGTYYVGDRSSADLYVLSLPLFAGYDILAMIAFIGGFSAATAMVIVASVALAIMISNDIIIPIFVRRLLRNDGNPGGDWSALILNIRRCTILVVLMIAYFYYRQLTQQTRLSAIGLMSFAAVAQFAPAFIGGLIWRGANARGAAFGMTAGALAWAYTLLMPSLIDPLSPILLDGPFGIAALRPQALFGTQAELLNHGVLWSLSINFLFYVVGSLSRRATARERIQAASFVPRDVNPLPHFRRFRTNVTVGEIHDTVARYLGTERTRRSFISYERENGTLDPRAPANISIIRYSEQLLASAVGSSSARLILSLLMGRHDRSSHDAYRLLDDATEALQHNRDLLQIALDQMEQGITVLDTDFRLTCWNRQFRFLFDLPEEMGQVGVSFDDVLKRLVANREITEQEHLDTLDRLTDFGRLWHLPLRATGRIIELRSNPMPGGGMVVTYGDITQRVEADLALKQANETLEQRVRLRTAELMQVNEELAQAQHLAEEANLGKTRFLAATGHDILQPLNAARLYASSLTQRMPGSDMADLAANVESSLDSVEAILSAVLDISRLDAGALKPSDSVFALDSLLRQVETDFRPLASSKGLDLRVVYSGHAVKTDRNLLRRLIQNLVSNALKYTRNGTVLVGVRKRGDLIEIIVADTGIGIAAHELQTVFSEFVRLEDGVREAQGLGLGLSIVDRIARVLQLELRVQSVRQKGTRFSVLLPIETRETPKPQAGPEQNMAATASFDGVKVLCIDNDPRILDAMHRMLSGWGCQVEIAADVEITGETATGPLPDIVLIDYQLDRSNGLDTVLALRARWRRIVPAILVTADRSPDLREKADQLGIHVLNKPVRPAALRLMMTRMMAADAHAEPVD